VKVMITAINSYMYTSKQRGIKLFKPLKLYMPFYKLLSRLSFSLHPPCGSRSSK